MKITSACELCGNNTSRPISLCQACQEDLPVLENSCTLCSIELGLKLPINSICGQCLQSPPAVDYALSLFHYDSQIAHMITQLKFSHRFSNAAIFGYLLAEKIQASSKQAFKAPQVIIPVPLHSKRLANRGFNQSLEIAKACSKKLNIPIDNKRVKRTKYTLAQSDLSAKDRRKNVKNCFKLEKALEHQHVVILDDVVTTGATCNELAELLKKEGVKTVGVWAIARA